MMFISQFFIYTETWQTTTIIKGIQSYGLTFSCSFGQPLFLDDTVLSWERKRKDGVRENLTSGDAVIGSEFLYTIKNKQ
jgi:hypothetical protein